MIPDIIKKKFEYYRQWFRTLLIKEFMNLPHKHQERFIVLIENFLQDCRKVNKEHAIIKEQTITISIKDVQANQNNKILIGNIDKSPNQTDMKVIVPNDLRIKKGSKLRHIVYSLDNKIWYSSKEQLLKEGI